MRKLRNCPYETYPSVPIARCFNIAAAFSSVAGKPRRVSACFTSAGRIVPLLLRPRLLNARNIVDSLSSITLLKSSQPIVLAKNVGFAFSMNALAYHCGKFRFRIATCVRRRGAASQKKNLGWKTQ